MKQTYIQGVVLAALSERLEQKQSTSIKSLTEAAHLSQYSVETALKNLETAERIQVERSEGIENNYTILDGPTSLEKQTLVMHLAHREAA